MPNNEETTTKFKVDISELKKAMQDAKREISIANSEFKAVSSSMDNWSKSTDGISAKLKQLDSNLKSQKTILSSLEAQYEAVVAEQGEGSAAADRLKVSINNQKATINQTEREISNYETSLSEVSKAEKIASATGKDVAEVLDDMGNEAKDAEGGFTVLKGAVATFAGNVMTSLVGSLKNGISNLANLANETREYRTEMGKLDTAFEASGHSAEAANTTYKDLYAVLGDEGQAVEAASHLAKLTDNEKDLANWTNIATGVYGTFGNSLPIEGLTEAANETAKVGQVTGPLADALNWAGVSEDKFNKSLEKCRSEQERQKLIMDTLNGLYSDAATKYEENNASVMEANRVNSDYQDTLASLGEKVEPVTTSLKEGFNGLLTKLLELVDGVDMEAFTAKIEEGFAVLKDEVLPAVKEGFQWILDNKDTLIAGLAGIAGGFAAFKVAGLINTVVTSFKAFKAANEGATIAQWLLNAAMNANPIMLIVTVIAAVVAAIATFIATNDNAREKFKEIWNSITGFFTETIPNAFKSVINWVKENWSTLLTFFINPFAGLFKYFYENNTKFKEFVDNAIKYIKELPSKVWTWLSNTITKVTTWISNLSAKAKEAGSNFINKVVEFVKQLPSKVWTWLVNVVTKVTTWRNNMVNKAKDAASSFINKVVEFVKQLPSKVWTWLVDVVSKIGTWGSNLASKGKEAAQKLLTSVVEKVTEIPSKIKTIATDIVTGLWQGMSDKVEWLKDKISGFVGDVTGWLKKFFKIGSPSKLIEKEVGQWLPKGLAVGIEKNTKYAIKAIESMSKEMLESEKLYLAEKDRLEKEAAQKEKEQRLASAKNAAELEKIKQEMLQEEQQAAQEAYLSDLEKAAQKEREEYDKLLDDLKAKFEEIQESQKSFSDSLLNSTNETYQKLTFKIGGKTEEKLLLADATSQINTLKRYSNTLDELIAKRGELPEIIKNNISSMDISEGLTYMTAMLNATDEQFNNYINNFKVKESLASKIAKTLFPADSINIAEDLFEGLANAANKTIEEVQTEFANTLVENIKTTVTTATDKLKEATVEMKTYLEDILNDFQKTIASIKTSTVISSSSGAGISGTTSFTQNIYSPKQLSRVDIYRQTKNLIGLAGGGN